MSKRGDQAVLAAARRRVDAGQHQRAGRGAAGPLRQQLRIVAFGRPTGAAKELRIETGRPARLPGVKMANSAASRSRCDARGVLPPVREAGGPGLRLFRGELVFGQPGAAGIVFVDPGTELGGRQPGKRQQQVAEIAFRIDRNHRHAVDRGFLDEAEAQAGLAAAGHADADRVRDQVAGVVEDRLVERLAGGESCRRPR